MIVGGLLVVLALFAAQVTVQSPLVSGIPAFFGFGALLVGYQRASAARRDATAAAAESPVLTQLSARLSDDYLLLRRVALPGQGLEADAILLGPHGALVMGVHAEAGSFTVRGDDWFTAGGTSGAASDHVGEAMQQMRESPSWALTRRVRTVQRIVRQHDLMDLPIHAAVVLARGELAAADQPSVAVVPIGRIASYVEFLRAPDPELLRDQVTQLADILTPLASGKTGGISETPSPASR